MSDQTDSQLLRDYAERRAEAAFGELLRRHVDFVYSAASRLVRDAHLAQDVTQSVFIALARDAGRLAGHPLLTGWLHRTTLNIAAQTIRTEVRRRAREQEAAAMNQLNAKDSDAAWDEIAPALDSALGELAESDRDLLLLRYFQHRSARDLAGMLGISEEAAQRRVSRAVEKLRELFVRRGVIAGPAGLAAAISGNAVQAAPAGLPAAISTAVAGALPAATAITTTQIIAMTTLQKAAVILIIAAAIGTAVYEARRAAVLGAETAALRARQAQLDDLRRERDSATNRAAMLAAELGRAKSTPAELLKLRGEATRLRESTAGADPGILKLATKVAQLKQKLEQAPDRTIPEMRFLTDKDWAEVAATADLSTEGGLREAFSNLRGNAVNTFLNQMMQNAMKDYLAANNNLAPGNLSALLPYFNAPVTQDMLNNYQLVQSGPVDNHADLVILTNHVDDLYDSNHGMSVSGAWGGGYDRVGTAVNSAIANYMLANSGQSPTDASQLQSYLDRPVDSATLQNYLNQNATNPPPREVMTMMPALEAYTTANNGKEPANPVDILPYITTSAQLAAFEKLVPEAGTLAPALNAYSAANSGQIPRNLADVAPYLATPGQQAAYQRLITPANGPGH